MDIAERTIHRQHSENSLSNSTLIAHRWIGFCATASPAVDWQQWRELGHDGQFTGAVLAVNYSCENRMP
jgi:hypothetical protein